MKKTIKRGDKHLLKGFLKYTWVLIPLCLIPLINFNCVFYCYLNKNIPNIVFSLLPMIFTILVFVIAQKDDLVCGIKNYEFRKLRTGAHFSLVEMIFVSILIFTYVLFFNLFYCYASLLFTHIVAITYSVWFVLQEIPLLQGNEKYRNRLASSIVNAYFDKKENQENLIEDDTKKSVKRIVCYFLDRYEISNVVSILFLKKELFDQKYFFIIECSSENFRNLIRNDSCYSEEELPNLIHKIEDIFKKINELFSFKTEITKEISNEKFAKTTLELIVALRDVSRKYKMEKLFYSKFNELLNVSLKKEENMLLNKKEKIDSFFLCLIEKLLLSHDLKTLKKLIDFLLLEQFFINGNIYLLIIIMYIFHLDTIDASKLSTAKELIDANAEGTKVDCKTYSEVFVSILNEADITNLINSINNIFDCLSKSYDSNKELLLFNEYKKYNFEIFDFLIEILFMVFNKQKPKNNNIQNDFQDVLSKQVYANYYFKIIDEHWSVKDEVLIKKEGWVLSTYKYDYKGIFDTVKTEELSKILFAIYQNTLSLQLTPKSGFERIKSLILSSLLINDFSFEKKIPIKDKIKMDFVIDISTYSFVDVTEEINSFLNDKIHYLFRRKYIYNDNNLIKYDDYKQTSLALINQNRFFYSGKSKLIDEIINDVGDPLPFTHYDFMLGDNLFFNRKDLKIERLADTDSIRLENLSNGEILKIIEYDYEEEPNAIFEYIDNQGQRYIDKQSLFDNLKQRYQRVTIDVCLGVEFDNDKIFRVLPSNDK